MLDANSNFFTRRYRVPHDRIGERWLLIAHLAVTKAFEIIRKEGYPLKSDKEPDITIVLENVLNNDVLNRGKVAGFDTDYFGKVRRVEVVNFDGTKNPKNQIYALICVGMTALIGTNCKMPFLPSASRSIKSIL